MPYDFTQQDDIHLLQRIAPERDLFLVLVLVLVFILEYYAFIFVLHSQWVPGLIFHGLGILLMYAEAQLKRNRHKDARFAWIAVVALPLMGPVAPGGILFALFWHFISKEKSLTFKEWRESIFPTEQQSLAETVHERISFGRDRSWRNYSITYLADIIKMGSDEKKREAIFKISRYYDPGFAPLLKMAMEDQHNVIRVQAAAAIAKLKDDFFSKSVELEKLRTEWPKKEQLLFDLARHYDNYAFSGLLDETQEQDNRLLALKHYREYIEQEPKDSPRVIEVRQLLGRLLLRMDMVPHACREFEALKNEGFSTPDIHLWHAQCLFQLRRYAELRLLAKENIDSALTMDFVKYPDNIRGTILLWAGPQEQKPV